MSADVLYSVFNYVKGYINQITHVGVYADNLYITKILVQCNIESYFAIYVSSNHSEGSRNVKVNTISRQTSSDESKLCLQEYMPCFTFLTFVVIPRTIKDRKDFGFVLLLAEVTFYYIVIYPLTQTTEGSAAMMLVKEYKSTNTH